MIDTLFRKALRLATLLLVLALILAGLMANIATGGDSRMIVLFTLAILLYGLWRLISGALWLWRKLGGSRERRLPGDEGPGTALWLSPRTIRSKRSAISHESRGKGGRSISPRIKEFGGSGLYSREYRPSTSTEQGRSRRRGRISGER